MLDHPEAMASVLQAGIDCGGWNKVHKLVVGLVPAWVSIKPVKYDPNVKKCLSNVIQLGKKWLDIASIVTGSG
jgi:hypothetical protein